MALILGCFCGLAIGGLSYGVFDVLLGRGVAIAVGALMFLAATALFTWAFR